jgi:nucleoside-diphosphate-sugar epimerase
MEGYYPLKLFAYGLGYSALHYIRTCRKGLASVAGTVRSAEKRESLRREGIEAFVMNDEGIDPAIAAAADAADAWLVSIAPDANGDPVLRMLASQSVQPMPRTIVYLSTIGVYGDHAGAWVDESTPTKPTSTRSQWRLEAENRWIDYAKAPGCDLHVLRLAGIYGPGRSAIDNLREGKARRIVKKGQVFNRIHVADIAQSIAACLARPRTGETSIWNITDNEPCPPQDVVAYAADLLGIEPPPETDFETAQMTPMARSFYSENKRVSNRALREDLGVALLCPTYREGLKSLLAQEK